MVKYEEIKIRLMDAITELNDIYYTRGAMLIQQAQTPSSRYHQEVSRLQDAAFDQRQIIDVSIKELANFLPPITSAPPNQFQLEQAYNALLDAIVVFDLGEDTHTQWRRAYSSVIQDALKWSFTRND